MTKNPFINALTASAYIVAVVTLMNTFVDKGGDASLIVPMAMLSLFTLSAAFMGYVFILQPLQLYLDGQKKEAVNLFVRTVAVFAIFTAAILMVVFVRHNLI